MKAKTIIALRELCKELNHIPHQEGIQMAARDLEAALDEETPDDEAEIEEERHEEARRQNFRDREERDAYYRQKFHEKQKAKKNED